MITNQELEEMSVQMKNTLYIPQSQQTSTIMNDSQISFDTKYSAI